MANKFRNYQCQECGAQTRRKRENYEPRVCLDCSLATMLEYFRAMVPTDRPAREAHQADNGTPSP